MLRAHHLRFQACMVYERMVPRELHGITLAGLTRSPCFTRCGGPIVSRNRVRWDATTGIAEGPTLGNRGSLRGLVAGALDHVGFGL